MYLLKVGDSGEARRQTFSMRLRILKSVDRPLETYAQGLRLCGNEISALGANAFTGINEISKRFVLIVPAILYDALQLPRFKNVPSWKTMHSLIRSLGKFSTKLAVII